MMLILSVISMTLILSVISMTLILSVISMTLILSVISMTMSSTQDRLFRLHFVFNSLGVDTQMHTCILTSGTKAISKKASALFKNLNERFGQENSLTVCQIHETFLPPIFSAIYTVLEQLLLDFVVNMCPIG